MTLKISIDLDDTILSFYRHFVDYFGEPKSDSEITKKVRGVLLNDKEFWLSQPLIDAPNFIPHCYCTARIIPKKLIREQIQLNNLPNAPIYQVFGFGLSKYAQLRRASANVHIDDSISNFIDLNSKGIPCLLIDRPHNQEWGPIGRIYSLDKDEIIDTYHLFKETMFDDFNLLINDLKKAG